MSLTKGEQATAQFLIDMADLFMGLRRTITVRDFKLYGYVGVYEGRSIQDYAWLAKEAPGTVSRCLTVMGQQNRWGQPGALLIDSSIAARNEKEHHLTQPGIEFLHKIEALRQTENGK